MARHRIELVSHVPNTFSILLSFGNGPVALRPFGPACVILGGAAFPRTLREKLFGWKPGLEVLNLYGPTEATVY
jgi:non-ribosomal peptide synthetase component F